MPWLIGYPRENIDWGPTIDTEKCIGCGMCLNCGMGVYGWKEGKSEVVQRDRCVVGCTTCANLCPVKAIQFPSLEKVRDIYKKEGLWNKMKQHLKEQGKINS